MDNLSKMSDCQLWKRKSLCMVIFSRSQRNAGFLFAVEYLKLTCKEVWQEMIMGHKTRVGWCSDNYKFYFKRMCLV